ncbi:MAG: DUF1214 domain-containing protein [Planctomycetota bacterium]|nr:DUF1214 domain-containing protein [Planctomycetota bacterium]
MAGIYGNSKAEAFYPFLATDSEGKPVDTSATRYTMTFAPDQLPPVRAFWSITMYDAKTQFLIDNPLDRYLINSPMLAGMKRDADGSLTIHIQHDSPGPERESNWLPAPAGPVFLVMRLYWPEEAATSGAWAPPPVVPVPGAQSGAKGRGERPGTKSVETVVRTDERYGGDGLFQGPRGWSYWNHLEAPRPIQNPNLWPDTQSTYFLARFALPAGARLTTYFDFPHARYFQFALYVARDNTFVSTGEALSGPALEPDPGSTNPFRVGADRRAAKRAFRIHILAADAPAAASEREPNTLYAGASGATLQSIVRIYLSDHGFDGAGWQPASAPGSEPAFRYEATLADGTRLSASEVVARFARPIPGEVSPPMTAAQWHGLVKAPTNDPLLDPATAPARRVPVWEKYWNIKYSILGALKSAEDRAKIPFAGAVDGGGDPTTQYFVTHINRRFGPVYVMRGKMPTFPDTYTGAEGRPLAVTPDVQTQYWSLVSCESAPVGRIVDGLADMQVPLDAERNYTIVVSRREDRPKNATLENGVAWLEWSDRGEGLDVPENRPDFGMLILRIMATNPTWRERPEGVTRPGMEAEIMGPYLPRGEYTDKATFEARAAR